MPVLRVVPPLLRAGAHLEIWAWSFLKAQRQDGVCCLGSSAFLLPARPGQFIKPLIWSLEQSAGARLGQGRPRPLLKPAGAGRCPPCAFLLRSSRAHGSTPSPTTCHPDARGKAEVCGPRARSAHPRASEARDGRRLWAARAPSPPGVGVPSPPPGPGPRPTRSRPPGPSRGEGDRRAPGLREAVTNL